jgi:hypothetical protein
VKEDKEIQHVISFSVSDIEELPFGPARYIRTFRVRSLLGKELVIRLSSESRLGLTLENEVQRTVMPKPRQRRRKDDQGTGRADS